MKKYIVIDVHEPDYGCEERPEGTPKIDRVLLRDKEKNEIVIEVEDTWLDENEVNVGDEVIVHKNKIIDLA